MIDNRAKILQVALALFAAHGYDGVGVQQICDAAGITKPTLYHYFNSKHGLFETLMTERSAPLIAGLTAATEYQRDLVMNLTRVVQVYFDFAADEPTFYRLLLATSFAPPSSEYYLAVAELQTQQYRLIAALFQQAAEQHGNLHGRQLQYAISFRGMIDSYIAMALQTASAVGGEDRVHLLVKQFMYGIFSVGPV